MCTVTLRATIERSGHAATGIEVPEDAVAAARVAGADARRAFDACPTATEDRRDTPAADRQGRRCAARDRGWWWHRQARVHSRPEPTTAVPVIARPVARGDAPLLCERLHALVQASCAEVIVCDGRALAADALSVDALARLQLAARRLGRQIGVHRTSARPRNISRWSS